METYSSIARWIDNCVGPKVVFFLSANGQLAPLINNFPKHLSTIFQLRVFPKIVVPIFTIDLPWSKRTIALDTFLRSLIFLNPPMFHMV